MSNSKFTEPRDIMSILTRLSDEQGGGPVLYVDPESGQIYVLNSEGHIILLGQSGTGKSRRGVVSMVLSLIKTKKNDRDKRDDNNDSFVVVDTKGHIRDATWCYAKEAGYNTITIDLRNPENSDAFNPLLYMWVLYKNGKVDKACDLARSWSHTIFQHSKHADPFWIDSARSIFEACVILLLQYGKPEEINILSIIKMIAAGVERYGPKKIFDIICEDCPDSIADFLLKNVRTAPNDTLNSILSSVFQPLNSFVESPSLIGMLTNSDFEIGELDVDQPFGVYIVTPDENTNYSSITSTIVTQITEHLIQLAHDKYSGKLPRRVNICIEECGNLGYLPNLGQLMSAGRSRNIRMAIVLQSLTQLDDIYGRSTAETIITNADTIVAFRTNRWETLEELSRKMGDRFVDYGNRISEERLIKPEEIGAMETGRALIMISGRIKYSTVLPDYTEIFPMDKWYPPQDYVHERKKPEIFDLKRKAMELNHAGAPVFHENLMLDAVKTFEKMKTENIKEELDFCIKKKLKKNDLYYKVEIALRREITGRGEDYEKIIRLANEHRINELIVKPSAEIWVLFGRQSDALAFFKTIEQYPCDVKCYVLICKDNYDCDDDEF